MSRLIRDIPGEPGVDLVPRTIWTRLHFVWAAVCVGVMTASFAVGYLVTLPFNRSSSHFAWWSGNWGHVMLRAMGIRVRVFGLERVDWSEPCVLVANHQNGLDIPAVASVLPLPFGFVAKAALEKVPFLGWVLKASPSVFVDPRDPRRSLESIRVAGARIREGCSVLVFPEGARSYDGRLIGFQKGAFLLAVESGVPIVPVTIVDAVAVFNERDKCSRPGMVTIVVGDPIRLEGMTRRDVPALSADVRSAVAAYLPESWRNPAITVP